MSSYYDEIGTSPTAGTAEIAAACDAKYLHWKGLVGHHNPETAIEASGQLNLIETIRTTLTDPSKRAEYDSRIEIGGTTATLVDPAAAPTAGTGTPTPRNLSPYGMPVAGMDRVAVPQPPVAQPGLWACPNANCAADNPPNTKFCFKCSTQIVQACPNCGQMTSLIATKRCGNCGYSYEQAKERLQLRQRVDQVESASSGLRANISGLQLQKKQSKAKNLAIAAVIIAVIGFATMAGSVGAGFVFLIVAAGLGWAAYAQRGSRLDPQISAIQSQIQSNDDECERLRRAYGQMSPRS